MEELEHFQQIASSHLAWEQRQRRAVLLALMAKRNDGFPSAGTAGKEWRLLETGTLTWCSFMTGLLHRHLDDQ